MGVAACALAALGQFGATASAAQAVREKEANILSGVYTAAQAERGEAVFAFACVRCHLADLSGNNGPALRGEPFLASWENDTLDGLFTKVRDSMPPRIGNAIISDEEKIDVVAYLLRVNGFPAGGHELEIDEGYLASIEIVRPDGQRGPVRNFALVRIVGCLTATPAHSWSLVDASEPVVVTAASPVVIAAGTGASRGAGSYALIGAARFDPASHLGHTVEATGLLYRSPGERLLTVRSLQAVSSSCPG